MKKPALYISGALLILVLGADALMRYVGGKQDKVFYKNAIVRDVDCRCSKLEDLSMLLPGKRVYLNDDNGGIDFSRSKWDNSIEEGDTVDVLARKSLVGEELYGLSIKPVDYK